MQGVMMPHLYQQVDGWFTFSSIYDEVVKKYPNGKYVEVGCWFGKSATYLLEKIVEENANAFVYFVDTFQGEPNAESQQSVIKSHGKDYLYNSFLSNINKVQYNNKEVIVNQSVLAAKEFEDDSLDFVFIDDDHELCYESMSAWYPKVKTGGCMAGHDLGEEDPNAPVCKAVNRFCKEKNIKVDKLYYIQTWRIIK